MPINFFEAQLNLDHHNKGLDKLALEAHRKSIADGIFTDHWSRVRELFEILDLENVNVSCSEINSDIIKIGTAKDISSDKLVYFKELIKLLIPWRVGPYQIFDQVIDTEWRSQYKWNRLTSVHSIFNNARVLDLGCNNGYFMLRLLQSNPRFVHGFDPAERTYFQFLILYWLLKEPRIFYERYTSKEVKYFNSFYDVVLCMGVLYHRRNPFTFLRTIKDALKKDGKLILETIVIPGESEMVLSVAKRYCMMNNVFWVPTVNALKGWLARSGFKDIEILDVSNVTTKEQCKTDYAPYFSLEEFSNAENPELTVEGYPAPLRVSLVAG